MSLRKPYRSVNEQLRILRSRGMAVDAGAGHVLRREGYYPIVNGYKDLFLDRKACLTAGDDRYGTGARFDDLYALFLFDRELRELLFSSITRAEAALKAVCAHEFTGLHPDEVNPYLNPDYYDSRCRPSAMALIDKVFKRILELDGNPRNRGDYGGKAYIRHCMEDHNGQVPLWVLANDLSFGQTYGSSKSSPRPSDWRSPKVSPVCMRTRTTGHGASPSSGWTASSTDWCSTATCARMTSAAIVPGTMGALTRTCIRPSVILVICLTRTITWNCSVASPHWSHG